MPTIKHRLAVAKRFSDEHEQRHQVLLAALIENEHVMRESLLQDEKLHRSTLTCVAQRVKSANYQRPAGLPGSATRLIKGSKNTKFVAQLNRTAATEKYLPPLLNGVGNGNVVSDPARTDVCAAAAADDNESVTSSVVDVALSNGLDCRRALASRRRQRKKQQQQQDLERKGSSLSAAALKRNSIATAHESIYGPMESTVSGSTVNHHPETQTNEDDPGSPTSNTANNGDPATMHPEEVDTVATRSQHDGQATDDSSSTVFIDEEKERAILDRAEQRLQLRCLGIERHALIFEYRSLWVATLDSYQVELNGPIKASMLEARKAIGVLQIQCCWRMYKCRKPFLMTRDMIIRLQKTGRGMALRQSEFPVFAVRTRLQRLVCRVHQGKKDRVTLGREFALEVKAFNEATAATKIQATYKMSTERTKFVDFRLTARMATKIQKQVRLWLDRVEKNKRKNDAERLEGHFRDRMLMSNVRLTEQSERIHILDAENNARLFFKKCLNSVLVSAEKRRVVHGFLESPAALVEEGGAGRAYTNRPPSGMIHRQPSNDLGSIRVSLSASDPKSMSQGVFSTRPASSPGGNNTRGAISRRTNPDALTSGPTKSRRRRQLIAMLREQEEVTARVYDIYLPEYYRRQFFNDWHTSMSYAHRELDPDAKPPTPPRLLVEARAEESGKSSAAVSNDMDEVAVAKPLQLGEDGPCVDEAVQS